MARETSLSFYEGLKGRFKRYRQSPSAKETRKIGMLMRTELVEEGNSPLLDVSVATLAYLGAQITFYPASYQLRSSRFGGLVAPSDAWNFIVLLHNEAVGADTSDTVEAIRTSMFRNVRFPLGDINPLLKSIDRAILRERERIMRADAHKHETVPVQDGAAPHPEQSKDAPPPSGQPLPEQRPEAPGAEAEKARILNEAEAKKQRIIAEAEAEKQRILSEAEEEKHRILSEAKRRSAEIVEAAKADASASRCSVRAERFAQDQQETQSSLSAIRESLMEVNTRIRKTEETLQTASTQKAFSCFSELFAMVSDIHASTAEIARERRDPDLENAVYNLEGIRDMISEYLAEYGIRTIRTAPGAAFNGKEHTVASGTDFDPKTAIVAASVRCGFAWGEQILQKEQVEIEAERRY